MNFISISPKNEQKKFFNLCDPSFTSVHFQVFETFDISGLGENGLVLDSAEFLDLNTKKWTKTSSLKVGRTEHAMALVYGIPTVIGGKQSTLY